MKPYAQTQNQSHMHKRKETNKLEPPSPLHKEIQKKNLNVSHLCYADKGQ